MLALLLLLNALTPPDDESHALKPNTRCIVLSQCGRASPDEGRNANISVRRGTVVSASGGWYEVRGETGERCWARTCDVVSVPAAVERLTKRMRVAPGDNDARHLFAIALCGAHDLDGALREIDQLIRHAPANAHFRATRAWIVAEKGDKEGAVKELDVAVHLAPKEPDLLADRGIARFQANQYQEAIDDLSKAIEMMPRHLNAYRGRSAARLSMGDIDGAVADLTVVIEHDPSNAKALSSRALVLTIVGRSREALRDYEAALQSDPNDLNALIDRANRRYDAKDYQGAESDWLAAHGQIREHPMILAQLAWLYATCPDGRIRDGQKALRFAQAASQRSNGKDWHCIRCLAAAYAEVGEFETAVDWARKACTVAPTSELQKQSDQYVTQLLRDRKPLRQ